MRSAIKHPDPWGMFRRLHWHSGHRVVSWDLCIPVRDQGCNGHPAMAFRLAIGLQGWIHSCENEEFAYSFNGQVPHDGTSIHYNACIREDCSFASTIFTQLFS